MNSIRNWHLIDVKGKVLGRVSVEIAQILSGKAKVTFVPYLDQGDFVVVTNAEKIKLTGKKETAKKYMRHSGFPGGLRVETFEKLIIRRPEQVLRHAVIGMLPKNKLAKKMIRRLRVFKGSEHPYQKQIKEN